MNTNCADLSFEGNIRDSQIGTLVFSIFFDQQSHIRTNIRVWTQKKKSDSCILLAVLNVGSLISMHVNSWFIMLAAQLVYDKPI